MGRKENEMAAENNVITKADIQYAREVDFINRFNAGLKSLMTVLGIVRPIPKQAGTVLKAYVADGTRPDVYYIDFMLEKSLSLSHISFFIL